MARKHGGLGRGLDALIPQMIPMYPERNRGDSAGADSSASTEVFFSDDDEPEQKDAGEVTGGQLQNESPSEEKPNLASPAGEQEKPAELASPAGEQEKSAELASPAGEQAEPSSPAGEQTKQAEPVSPSEVQAEPASPEEGQPETAALAEDKSAEEKPAEEKPAAEKPVDEKPAASGAAILVRISQVEPNRNQPREVFDEEALEELAESIRQYGILQPLLVQDRGDYYEIIAGERRWRAALKAGLHEIPVVVRSYNEQEIMELSLIENIQREDLNPIEEAQAYQRLLEEFGLKQEEVAARVSKSRAAITNTLRLLKLEERVRKMVSGGELSMGQARPLLALTIPEEQYTTACRIAQDGLSVREVEKLVKQMTTPGKEKSRSKKEAKQGKPDPQLQAIYRSLEEKMKSALQTKVRIRDNGSGTGHLEIDFYGTEDLERLIDKLV